MRNRIIRAIEKWAINKLYLLDFHTSARINRHSKKIIFQFCFWIIWRQFSTNKERFYFAVLTGICGYKVYERQPNFFNPAPLYPPRHTWGEIQDIIRLNGRFKPIRSVVKPLLKSDAPEL